MRLRAPWRAWPWFRAIFFTALALVSSRVVSSQTVDLENALSKPLTPGSVGLLVEHTRKEEAVERLTTALEDPHPDVRAAAARASRSNL